jgi:hypothetical protein
VTVSDTLNIGDATTRTVTFKNVAGDPTDPTTTTATLYLPDGTSTSPSITNGTTGVRSVTITPTMSGTHRLKWAGTGAVAEVEWDVFTVDPDPTVSDTDIITLGEAKKALKINDGTTTFDDQLRMYVTAVSDTLDDFYGPVVYRTVTDEVHAGGRSLIFLNEWPVASITAVTEYASGTATTLAAETATASTGSDYLLDASRGYALVRRSSWSDAVFAASSVKVTYVAGRYATTADVDARWKLAAQITLRHWWRPEESVGTDTFGAIPAAGGDIPTFAFPRVVAQFLERQRRPIAVA